MAFPSFLRRLWIARLSNLAQPARPRTKVHRKLLLEQLEERTVLSPYLVTTTADSGSGSLRDAINSINNDTAGNQHLGSQGVDEIDFAIPTTDQGYNGAMGTFNIRPSYLGLPTINEPVVLDATTQPTYSTHPVIVLDGVNTTGGSPGLTITAGNSVVKGLDIGGFAGGGLALTTNGGDVVEGNYIGTDATGTSAVPNGSSSGFGVLVASSNNIIGGTSAAARNVISGNNIGIDRGLFIYYSDSNYVQGNFIGVDATGNAALGNYTGIDVEGGQFNVIGVDGTNNPAAGNVISGNLDYGVGIVGVVGIEHGGDNVFAGNLVGLGADGTTVLGNTYGGVVIDGGGSGNTIGGTTAAARNVISGNGEIGIAVGNGDGTAGNLIEGNYIGTDATGLLARPNGPAVSGSQAAGVWFLGAGANILGGTAAGAGNVISGNGTGVLLSDGTTGVQIEGNSIGVNAAGTALGNQHDGVLIGGPSGAPLILTTLSGNSVNNTIGDTAPGAGNVIAFNGMDGVDVDAGYGNSIRGNSIHENGLLGIDLNFGVYISQPGPNNYQNNPVLSGATGGSTTEVRGTLHSSANTAYALDFYASPSAGNGQGQRFLGSATVTTDANRYAIFDVNVNQSSPGEWITATATEVSSGNTSEFSQSLLIANVMPPAIGLTSGNYSTTYEENEPPISFDAEITDFNLADLQSGPTYSWTVTKNGLPFANGVGTETGSGTYYDSGIGYVLNDFSFTPDAAGTYVVSLVFTDINGSATANQTIDITVPPPNQLTDLNFVVGPHYLTPVNNTLYFLADAGNGQQLWRTDGRPGDAAEVESAPQSVVAPDVGWQQQVAQVGSWVYFFSDNSDGTYTLWRNDSAVSPTNGASPSQKILCLEADPTGGPTQLTAVGSTLYFGATVNSEWQLCKVAGADGSNPAFSTVPIANSDSSGPWDFKAAGSYVYFSDDYINNGTTNYVLWGSDGTTAGTAPITDGSGNYIPGNFGIESDWVALGTDLYEISGNGYDAGTLWRVTGLGATAVASVGGPVETALYGDYHMTVVGGILYFTAGDQAAQNGSIGLYGQYDLWKCEGSTATQVWESPPGGDYAPLSQIVGVGSEVYFMDASGDGGLHTDLPRLWKSDGTNGGTELVTSLFSDRTDLDAIPYDLTAAGSTLYFLGRYGALWQSGGTPATTQAANSGVDFGFEMSISYYDLENLGFGTAHQSNAPLVTVGSTLFYTTNGELGTTSGELGRLNDPPVATVGQTDPSGAALAGEVVTFALGANDPDTVDQAGGFTYQIDYGDGTNQTVTGPSGFQVLHAYNSPGTYTVNVTATDQAGGVSALASSAPVQVNALNAGNLQTALPSGGALTIQANTVTDASTVVQAINDLSTQNSTVNGTVTLNLAPITYGGLTVNVPNGMTLVIGTTSYTGGQQAIIDPATPAFTVGSGNVIVSNITFITTGDAPTILVTGGHLTLRNDTIQESTGSNDAAISVTGGTVDLGTANDPGSNTINVTGAGAFVYNTTSHPVAAVGDTFTVNGSALTPSSLSGFVFEDFNDDGQLDFGENGISGVTIKLTGTDDLGNAVNLSQLTDSDGAYVFLNLRPGNYSITETQPAGYLQGIDSVGTAGGSLTATDRFFVQLGVEVNGLNYNYGEQPAAGGSVQHGQTAGIGFWNNKNGQALIRSLPVVTNADGSVTSVANWLAATLPNIFGVNAGSNDLAGKSNAFVATLFQSDFLLKGVKLDAQVLATALSVYATNATLDPTQVAASYGFTVSADGAGTATVNVGVNGDAFGVANNAVLTVMDLLLAADAQAVDGILYNGNATKRNEANNVFSAVNQAGDIS